MSNKKGFTLIELLVVIAIIGILASVVLASLNSARSKGSDVAIRANLANIRAQAALYYDANNTYGSSVQCRVNVDGTTSGCSGVFNTKANGGVLDGFKAAVAITSTQAFGITNSAGDAWSAAANLKSGGYYCVDSAGSGKTITGTTGGSAQSWTVCP